MKIRDMTLGQIADSVPLSGEGVYTAVAFSFCRLDDGQAGSTTLGFYTKLVGSISVSIDEDWGASLALFLGKYRRAKADRRTPQEKWIDDLRAKGYTVTPPEPAEAGAEELSRQQEADKAQVAQEGSL